MVQLYHNFTKNYLGLLFHNSQKNKPTNFIQNQIYYIYLFVFQFKARNILW